jgi:polyribonucleotide nucleotidyltransferase
VGAVRVGLLDGEFVVNPTFEQMEQSSLDLRIAGTRDAILMVECGASEVPEDVMVKALEFGHKAFQPFIDVQEQMAHEVGKPKREYKKFVFDEKLVADVRAKVGNRMAEALSLPDKEARNAALDALEKDILAAFAAEGRGPANGAGGHR